MRSHILQSVLKKTPAKVLFEMRYLGARQYLCHMLQQYGKDDFRVRPLITLTMITQHEHHRQLPTSNQQPATRNQ